MNIFPKLFLKTILSEVTAPEDSNDEFAYEEVGLFFLDNAVAWSHNFEYLCDSVAD